MSNAVRCLAALTIAGVAALGACHDDRDGPAIEVRDAWARATPAGATTGAVYMTLRAADDDALARARVDPAIAATATVHETVTSAGQMSMDHAAGIALPAGEAVAFEPGGLHVMLEGLAAPLVAGDSFALTLDFDRAPDLTVTVDVGADGP